MYNIYMYKKMSLYNVALCTVNDYTENILKEKN